MQDKCLQRQKNELVQLFEEEFGKSYTDMFESFTEEPIAAASLAQVTHFYVLNYLLSTCMNVFFQTRVFYYLAAEKFENKSYPI